MPSPQGTPLPLAEFRISPDCSQIGLQGSNALTRHRRNRSFDNDKRVEHLEDLNPLAALQPLLRRIVCIDRGIPPEPCMPVYIYTQMA